MAETDTASAITVSLLSSTTYTIQPASEIGTAQPVYFPLYGYFISDPLPLSGAPVTASIIRWAGSVPAGTTLTVETSINNGASWDAASNNRPIPRLEPGDIDSLSVLVRITFTRPTATTTAPTVSYLEMQVSTDVGVDEVVPIGRGFITKVTATSTGGSQGGGSSSSGGAGGGGVTTRGGGQTGGGTSVQIHVIDFSQAIARNKWTMTYTVPSGLTYDQAIVAMAKDRAPWLTDEQFRITTTTRTLPDLVVYGNDDNGDPWQDMRKLAQACGFEVFFDGAGSLVFQPVPDPRYTPAVYTFDSTINPIITESKKELSDEQTVNWVVVRGQSTSSANAVAAEAYDNDPSSRTYVLGKWGIKSERLTFPLVTTTDQAQDTADAILKNSIGAAETVTITHPPIPFLEPGDVVRITEPNVKAAGTYYIQSTTISAQVQQTVAFRQSTNTVDSAAA